MAIQARVTSSDALESFRAALVVYLSKARVNVDDAVDEVRRMKTWLQHDQMVRWEGEIRRRQKTLDQAMSDLRNAQFAENHSAIQARQAVVTRTKQAITEAEDKLRRTKKWAVNFDSAADPVIKKLESFRGVVVDELPKAIAHLRNLQKVIEAYAETGVPVGDGPATTTDTPAEPPGETAPPVTPATP